MDRFMRLRALYTVCFYSFLQSSPVEHIHSLRTACISGELEIKCPFTPGSSGGPDRTGHRSQLQTGEAPAACAEGWSAQSGEQLRDRAAVVAGACAPAAVPRLGGRQRYQLAVLEAGRPRSRGGWGRSLPRRLSWSCQGPPSPCVLTGLSARRVCPHLFHENTSHGGTF